MKIRQGFVSNSSSASFVVERSHLSDRQIEQIQNHIEECQKFDDFETYLNPAWIIYVKEDYVRGHTFMDNFDIVGFMKRIGVPEDAIEYFRD